MGLFNHALIPSRHSRLTLLKTRIFNCSEFLVCIKKKQYEIIRSVEFHLYKWTWRILKKQWWYLWKSRTNVYMRSDDWTKITKKSKMNEWKNFLTFIVGNKFSQRIYVQSYGGGNFSSVFSPSWRFTKRLPLVVERKENTSIAWEIRSKWTQKVY